MKKSILLACFLSVSIIALNAQQTVLVSGGDYTGANGSISYSIGQIAYTTMSGTEGSVAQGVQQPYEISVITDVCNTKDINVKLYAYPNPTSDILTLEIENPQEKTYTAAIYNISGELLVQKELTVDKTTFTMSEYSPSTYFIRVIHSAEEIKVFKIIKH